MDTLEAPGLECGPVIGLSPELGVRRKLWREPATKVARRYSISSVALGKICRELCS